MPRWLVSPMMNHTMIVSTVGELYAYIVAQEMHSRLGHGQEKYILSALYFHIVPDKISIAF